MYLYVVIIEFKISNKRDKNDELFLFEEGI